MRIDLSRLSFILSALVFCAALKLAVFLFLPAVAFAQAAAGDTSAAAAFDPVQALQQAYDGIVNGKGWIAAGPILSLVVWALRKYDTMIPVIGAKIDGFLNQPLVAFLLPALLSALTGLFGALGQGLPVVPALLAALKTAAASAFTFLALKNAAEQVKGAQAAGSAAASDPSKVLGA